MRRLPVVMVVLAWSAEAHAGDKPLYAPVPAWVKPAPAIEMAKQTGNAPVVVVLDNQQRLAKGEVTEYVENATRIASTQLQAQLGTLSLPWQPDKGDLIVHRIEILRGTERIDLIEGKEPLEVLRREIRLEQLELDGTLTATMQVPGLRVGDVLHVAYSTTNTDRALKGRMQAYAPIFATPFKAGFARTRLLWQSDADVRVKAYAEGVALKPTVLGQDRELEIMLPLAKQPEIPEDAPMRYQRPPVIEASTFADWSDVSRVMAPLFATQGTIAPNGPIAKEIDAIRKEADPTRRAAKALELVQGQIRYQAIGMDGGNYVPQSPEKTWQVRYGDCKAKTLLLLAILHELQIDAEPVLANVFAGGLVSERLPAPGAFNHVIVRATIGGRSLWLDGTGSGDTLEDIGNTPAFRTVLPLRAAGAGLMPLPIVAPYRPDMTVKITADDRAGLGLPSIVEIAITQRGPVAEAIRVGESQMNQEERQGAIQAMVQPLVGEMQVSQSRLTFDTASGTATVYAKGVVTTPWRLTDRRFSRSLDRAVDSISFAPDRARAAWRSIPVQTRGPGAIVFDTTILLPQNGVGFELEGDRALPAVLAGNRVAQSVKLSAATVTVAQRLEATAAEIAPADIPQTRAALANAKSTPLRLLAPKDYPARWQLVLDARRTGRLAAIENELATAIAANTAVDPEDLTGYSTRAQLRAGTYDHKGAIADFDRIIAAAPDAATHVKRADLFRALGDDAHARADFEAARALDPESDDARLGLASVLADGKDTTGAVALLDPKIAEGGQFRSSWIMAKASILGDTGQQAAALKLLDDEIVQRPSNPRLFNARCWRRATSNVGLDDALKDCNKSIELSDNAAAALDSRALVYFRMGRNADALSDLDAALEASPAQSGSFYLRGIVRRRMGQTKEGDVDLAAARMITPDIARDYKRWGIAP